MDDKLPPIAIVGMSWRFPGEAWSASGFWDILRKGESAKTRIPAERFDPDAYYHPSADRQGAVSASSPFLPPPPSLIEGSAHFAHCHRIDHNEGGSLFEGGYWALRRPILLDDRG